MSKRTRELFRTELRPLLKFEVPVARGMEIRIFKSSADKHGFCNACTDYEADRRERKRNAVWVCSLRGLEFRLCTYCRDEVLSQLAAAK